MSAYNDALVKGYAATGTFACPVCGVETPHDHSVSELTERYLVALKGWGEERMLRIALEAHMAEHANDALQAWYASLVAPLPTERPDNG